MNDSPEQPQGRSMTEIRAILAADTARWERLAEAWPNLTDEEQERLTVLAESAAAEDES